MITGETARRVAKYNQISLYDLEGIIEDLASIARDEDYNDDFLRDILDEIKYEM